MGGHWIVTVGGVAKVDDLYCECSDGVGDQVEVVLPFLWRSNVDLVGVARVVVL